MPLPPDNLFFGLGPKLTEEQRNYLNSIFDNRLTICNARAGTGKTTIAVGAAKLIGKPLLYIFNPTEERVLGYRPGSVAEKEAAYLGPLKSALLKINENPEAAIYNPKNMDAAKRGAAWVTALSHTFLRGDDIEGKTVIIDETQNFTVQDLRKALTRLHDDCTVIMIGHTGQIDLQKPELSGFARYIDHFRDKHYAKVCELSVNFRGELANDADSIE